MSKKEKYKTGIETMNINQTGFRAEGCNTERED